jgi:aminoglycoside phosphotransferase (APT) family kinase protein
VTDQARSTSDGGWEDLVDLDALTHWMDKCGIGRGAIQCSTLLGGGTQNILLRFERGDRAFVLRRPPRHLRSNSNGTMRREMRMLAALAGSNVPHPALIAACPDVGVIGVAFYLMEPVQGFNATMGLPPLHASSPAIRHRMGLALVEGIAALGSLDYRAAGLSDFGKPQGYLERQVGQWRTQLKSYKEFERWPGLADIPGIEELAIWLDARRPPSARPGIVHGDYHLANVMYRHDEPELAAIIDWELTTIGDPLIDLGWLLATWPEEDVPDAGGIARVTPWNGFPRPDELVSHYEAHSDRDLTNITWYAVLACYKLGIILEGTYARACAGKAPKETGARLHASALRLFARGREWIS